MIILKKDPIISKQHDKQFKLDTVQYDYGHQKLNE